MNETSDLWFLIPIWIAGGVIAWKGLRMAWGGTQWLMTCHVCGYEAKQLGVSVHIQHIGEEVQSSKVEYLCADCQEWAGYNNG